MFCFAYDYEEYVEKRGLYMDWEEFLPCPIDRDEDTLIKHILEMDAEQCTMRTDQFRKKVAPHAGHASQCVTTQGIEALSRRMVGMARDLREGELL